MVIIKNSFTELCRQLQEKDKELLKNIPDFLLAHNLSGVFLHIQSFLPVMKPIFEIEKKYWVNEENVTYHIITPDALNRNIIWKDGETDQDLFKELNPISNFSLKWDISLINDRKNNKMLGFIHFQMYKTWVPVTKAFIANKANLLEMAEIFHKISEEY